MRCRNCGETELAVTEHHVHLSTGQVVEMALCESCRYRFVTADWVNAVI